MASVLVPDGAVRAAVQAAEQIGNGSRLWIERVDELFRGVAFTCPRKLAELRPQRVESIGVPPQLASDDGSVWGIVASGARNMVPALVRVQAEAAGSGKSRVHVRATGKEGLISSAEAAHRLAGPSAAAR